MKLSFVIPCYRSEKTIEKVINEIIETVHQRDGYDYEIICVNDCSPDDAYTVIRKLAVENRKIKAVSFARNMGKHAAVLAGYSYISGDYVVNLDDDFQSPINNLWTLIDALQNDECDVAIAQYKEKKQAKWKTAGSNFNLRLGSYLMDKPSSVRFENFSAMKRFVAEEMKKYDNPYPFLEGLMWRTTCRIKSFEMEEREREDGQATGYTLRKSLALFLNGFTAFSVKPLRITTVVGFIAAAIGFIWALVLIIQRIAGSIIVAGYTSSMVIQLIIGGLILMSLGLLGEYIGRMYISMNKSPQYVIKETINCEKK